MVISHGYTSCGIYLEILLGHISFRYKTVFAAVALVKQT